MPIEINHFEDVEPHLGLPESTLLVLDIDQTLIRCPYQWGGEPWYYYLIAENRKKGMSERDAVLEADREWEDSQRVINPGLMETQTAALVERWKSRGVVIVGLTARAPTIASRTHEQLLRLGISFSVLSLKNEEVSVPDSVFENGIFFVGALEPKGKRFPLWYEAIANPPPRLVFVDDRHEHTRSMETWMHQRGLAGVCLRYGASDPLKVAFDPAVAKAERKQLRKRK